MQRKGSCVFLELKSLALRCATTVNCKNVLENPFAALDNQKRDQYIEYEKLKKEGEKAVLICSIVYPKDKWLAVGCLGMKSRAFHLKEAVIYPEKGKAFKEWKERCPERFRFDRTVEESDLKEGEDIVDLICIQV